MHTILTTLRNLISFTIAITTPPLIGLLKLTLTGTIILLPIFLAETILIYLL